MNERVFRRMSRRLNREREGFWADRWAYDVRIMAKRHAAERAYSELIELMIERDLWCGTGRGPVPAGIRYAAIQEKEPK